MSISVAANVRPNAPRIPYLSNVTGELATAEMVCDPGYWARYMCETVQFGAGLAHVLADREHMALAEIGPGCSLGALTRGHPDCEPNQWPLIVAVLPGAAERRDGHEALAEAVGRLWLTGVGVDWHALHAAPAVPITRTDPETSWSPGRVPLPSYPFERQEYWLES